MEVLYDKEKIKAIDAFMKALLEAEGSAAKNAVYAHYKPSIQQIEPIDLFRLHLYQDASNIPIDTIKESANRFVNVFQQPLKAHAKAFTSHPLLHRLDLENTAILKHLDATKRLISRNDFDTDRDSLHQAFEACLDLEKKFVKKENILFPALEDNVPSNRPLTVMWSLHDDARKELKQLLHSLSAPLESITELKSLLGSYYYLIYGLIEKERLILFPVAHDYLKPDDAARQVAEADAIGYAFEMPLTDTFQPEKPVFDEAQPLTLPTGQLTLGELTQMLDHLPLDITFVGEDDRVRYFNNTQARYFPRTASIIGRHVEHCHPEKSVRTVKEILSAFKAGTQDMARFHISHKEHFVVIDYYAVRDRKGQYRGVLEVSQNIEDLQKLSGEKRLLNWKGAPHHE